MAGNRESIDGRCGSVLRQKFVVLYPAAGEDCDEAFALCSLYCLCVWQSEHAEACLAAIVGTYAAIDMAGRSPLPATYRGAGGR